MKITNRTPKQDGYRMPGEFEKHQGCWMLWPFREDNWREAAKPAQNAFLNVARTIAKYEKVSIGVPKALISEVSKYASNNISIVEIESDDAWMRDVGPTFLVNDNGNVRAVDWRFNAWGGLVDGLYDNWDQDDKVAARVCEIANLDYYSLPDFILEGGSIHVDGEGTVIVTEECLLHQSRNPQLSKSQIEEILCEYLNVSKVLWLPCGIYNDETNGHVDNIIHYCKPAEVVLAWTDDIEDAQYNRSYQCLKYLESQTDAKGRKFKIHKLHIPNPITITQAESEGVVSVGGTLPRLVGDRQAASYANFYIANKAIILPLFGDEKYDKMAVETLEKVFPNYKIEGVYAREIILGGGNIHCITQQQPVRNDQDEK